MKIKFFNNLILDEFLRKVSIISAIFTIVFVFYTIPNELKFYVGGGVALFFALLYVYLLVYYNRLRDINLKIDGSSVSIITGDLFEQPGFKVISFNEYFDTIVDDKIISKNSMNGIYINRYSNKTREELDKIIDTYEFEDGELVGYTENRKGKSKKYKIGTICVVDDYLLVAFSKFDRQNKAILSMPEYLEFLINFWDSVNRVYAKRSVSVPIFGSGITRFKGLKNITDEELLKIMLWTFRISEMKFKYPAKLNIIIYHDKIKMINLLDIKMISNGL